MTRPSSIDQLPEEVRTEIGRLRTLGWTIDQILEQLRTLLDQAPSRSAVGRHLQKLDKLTVYIGRAQRLAESVVQKLGDAPESRSGRLNIELMQSGILDLLLRAADAEDGEVSPLGSAKEAALMAKALADLARARQSDADVTLRLKRELAAEMEKKLRQVETEATAQAMTPADVLERVRALYRGEA